MPAFSVTTIASGDDHGPWVVAVRGDLDISGVARVRRALTDLEAGERHVIALDLREVVHLDSSALRLLLDAEERARRRGRRFVVVAGPRGAVARLLTLTMLAGHVEVVGDLAVLADPA